MAPKGGHIFIGGGFWEPARVGNRLPAGVAIGADTGGRCLCIQGAALSSTGKCM